MHKVTVTKDNYEVDRLYQWDLNQVLCISGLSLKTVPEVHFAHPNDNLAIVRKATMGAAGVVRAEIPNSLLQKALRIDAYVCTYEGETFQTICKVKLPVHPRAKPSDYEGTDDAEVFSLEALQVEMVELEPGDEAKVEKVLTGEAWTLRFSIPRGRDGEDGKDGAPGYTPQKNVDYFDGEDGYTPVKGKDYFDGQDGYTPVKGIDYFDGEPGKDGYTPQKNVDYFDGQDGYTPVKGKDYFDGQDGSSIQSIQRTAGNGAPGTTDTYTVTLTDGSKTTFQVYNGADGEGAGDMTSQVYDPQGKALDIFKYAEDLLKTIDASRVTFADGQTWQQKYDAGAFDGEKGEPGYTPVKGKDYFDGAKGDPGYTPVKGVDYFDGQNGKDGTSVTVSSVSESTADGGTSVVTFSDGKKLNVKNGSKGSDGAPGYTPQKGVDYFDGQNGKDGKTPVKGTDYWTAADKAAMVNDVLAALPAAEGGSY